MKRITLKPLALVAMTALLVACTQQDPPSKNTPRQSDITAPDLETAQFVEQIAIPEEKTNTSNWKGMTWRVLEQKGNVVRVGADKATNPYKGDTSAYAKLPILCLKVDGRAAPKDLKLGFSNGWARGELKLTPTVPGTVLNSVETANRICESEFGTGWRMAEFHDGYYNGKPGGWHYYANGKLNNKSRFWVNINDQKANPWNSDGVKPQTKIPKTTKMMGQLDRNGLISIQENSLTIRSNSPMMKSLKVGDVIVSETSPQAPDGLLRKVKSISKRRNTTVINTELAMLEEAIEDGELADQQTLNMAHIDYERSGSIIQAMQPTPGDMQAQKDFKLFEFKKNPFCLYSHSAGRKFDCDNGAAGGLKSQVPKDNFITIDANLNARADAYINLKIKWFKLKKFNTGVKVKENASVKFHGKGSYNWKVDKELDKWRITFKPIKFWIGPVPVILRPSLVPTMGTNGHIRAELKYEVNQSFNANSGAEYIRKKGWKKINSSSFQVSHKLPVAQGNAEAKAYIGLKAMMSLYSKKAASIYFHGKAYGKGTAQFDIPKKSHEICTYYGFTADVGVEAPMITKKKFEKTVIPARDKKIKCWGKNGIPNHSYKNVKLDFTSVVGQVKVYNGKGELIYHTNDNNSFDLTPHLYKTGTSYFRIRNIITKKGKIIKTSQRSIDLNVVADGQSIWNPGRVQCKRCHSADVYKFTINKEKGEIKIH